MQGLEDYKRAIEYHEKALQTFIEIGDKDGISNCYTGIGSAYEGLGDYIRATEYYKKALQIRPTISNL